MSVDLKQLEYYRNMMMNDGMLPLKMKELPSKMMCITDELGTDMGRVMKGVTVYDPDEAKFIIEFLNSSQDMINEIKALRKRNRELETASG